MRYKYIVISETPRIIDGKLLSKGDVFFLDRNVSSTHFIQEIQEKKPEQKNVKKEIKSEVKKELPKETGVKK